MKEIGKLPAALSPVVARGTNRISSAVPRRTVSSPHGELGGIGRGFRQLDASGIELEATLLLQGS